MSRKAGAIQKPGKQAGAAVDAATFERELDDLLGQIAEFEIQMYELAHLIINYRIEANSPWLH